MHWQCHILINYYCSAVWSNVNRGPADKLQRMQNRASRILTFSNYEVHSSVLLDELGWERLEYVRLKQLAVTMYNIHNNLSPLYLRWIFTNTSNVHSHNLRKSELNYYVPRPRTESAKGSLHYRGSILWNKIPSDIRNLPSLNIITYFSLRAKCWLRGGVGGQFPKLASFTEFYLGITWLILG